MKIKKLIKLLRNDDPERIIVLSDAEGNYYSPLVGTGTAAYYDGEIGLEKLTPELKKEGYTEEDVMDYGKPALILYSE